MSGSKLLFKIRGSRIRKNNRLFSDNIDPACEYCAKGKKSENGMILCAKVGVVMPSYSCKKFKYNPLKRRPKRMNYKLPQYAKEDFEI